MAFPRGHDARVRGNRSVHILLRADEWYFDEFKPVNAKLRTLTGASLIDIQKYNENEVPWDADEVSYAVLQLNGRPGAWIGLSSPRPHWFTDTDQILLYQIGPHVPVVREGAGRYYRGIDIGRRGAVRAPNPVRSPQRAGRDRPLRRAAEDHRLVAARSKLGHAGRRPGQGRAVLG